MADVARTGERIAFLRRLRAVRQFRAEPVPPAVVDDVLTAARWSGSAKNRQPWELVLVRDRETLRALAAADGSAGHLAGAALGIVVVMAGDPSQSEQETFDEGRLSERIMLAAAAHGVGSCVGWFRGPGRAAVKQLLRIPPERLVRTAISLGYPDTGARPARPPRSLRSPARKPLSEMVHQDVYGGT